MPVARGVFRADLHTHSTASDGTTPPDELMRQAAEAGLSVIALTDHDTTAGWQSATAALPPGVTLLPGAEISCSWLPPGAALEAHPISIHLLAYGFDPEEPQFLQARAGVRISRTDRGMQIVALLRADGHDISWQEVQEYAGQAPVGRPHIASVLRRHGLVPSMAAAFAPEWLGRRYRVPKANIDIFTAVRLVRGAGGVPVLAHPKASSRGRVIPDGLIAELAGAGLAGLEADHADHDSQQRDHVRALAAATGLFVTGSSDFHGSHKQIALGANATTTPVVYEQILAQATGVAPVTG
ncbi:MAG: PHP domain-containing protein [Mycobacteriales bacterium]